MGETTKQLENKIKELERKLHQTEEMFRFAGEFADLWVWIYQINENRVYCYKKLQDDFLLPEYLPGYPQSWLDKGYILDEFQNLYKSKVESLKAGSDSEEFDCQVRYLNGSVHWIRVRMNRLKENWNQAICTSQVIDTEKYLEARIEVEEKHQSEGKTSLLAHFITNVTQSKPVKYYYNFKETKDLLVWSSLENQLERTKKYIVNQERIAEFLNIHDPEYMLDQFAKGNTELSMDYLRLFPDGKIIWVRSLLHLVQNPKNGDILNYEYLYDIHQEKIYEELMQAVVEFGFEICASLMLDSDQATILYAQKQYGEEKLRVSSYTERNRLYAESILEEDRKAYLKVTSLENIKVQMEKKDHFDFVHRTLENGEVHYKKDQCYGYTSDHSACLLIRSDVTDIVVTEQQKQKELKIAMEKMQKALNSKEELIQVRNRLYAALFQIVPMVVSSNLSKNYYGMLNYDDYTTKVAPRSGTYDELIEVGAGTIPLEQRELFRNTFSRENVIKAYENGAKNVALEHQQLGDDGVMRWIHTRGIFVKNTVDGDLYSITLAQDITDKKTTDIKIEKALEAAEAATQAKSEFLSRMSHEIRTPMNAIMGMTAIAKENRADYLQVEECLDKIEMSSKYLLTLINDILEMSRIESGRMEIKSEAFSFLQLMESIRTVIEPLAIKSNVRYEFLNQADAQAYYLGDSMRIQQVLVNLLSNAIKFTKSGGRVRFQVRILEQDPQQTIFSFKVADTGIGMSEKFMNQMFKPFTQEDSSNTSEYGGSGLGLAISKNLVEVMKGNIRVESFAGIGSTFTVELPLRRLSHDNQQYAAQDVQERRKRDFRLLEGCHILMAEDHPLNVMVAKKILERKKVLVTVVSNGRQAVDTFRESQPGYFDVILMDIRMPVLDGLHASMEIRKLRRSDAKSIPIIAMTANALEEDRRRTKEAGMDEHLAKPFEPMQLYEVIEEQLENRKVKSE